MNKKLYIYLGLIFLVIAGIVLIYLFRQNQDTRTRAAVDTAFLQFSPTTASLALEQTIPVDIKIDTKSNNVTGADITISIDPKLEFVAFTPSNVFNTVLITRHDIGTNTFRVASVNTASNPIIGVVSLGSLELKAKSQGNGTLVFSKAQITSSGQDTATPVDTSGVASITISDGGTPTIAPTTDPEAVEFTFTIFLHNIGKFGDTVNPNSFQFSNQNPLHPEKPVTVELISANSPTITQNGTINYNQTNGNFLGKVVFTSPIPAKTYQVKIKSPQYLRKDLGLHPLGTGTSIAFPVFDLVTGDINNDNKLDVLDYNMLLTCYSTTQNPACTQANRVLTDLNDDGKVDTTDYNLFLRESSVRNGE